MGISWLGGRGLRLTRIAQIFSCSMSHLICVLFVTKQIAHKLLLKSKLISAGGV